MTEEIHQPAPHATTDPPPAAPEPSASRRGRWLAVALLALGVVLIVLFGLRTARSYSNFHEVRGRPIGEDVERLRPWMTIPDLARDFDVPVEFLYSEMGVTPQQPDRRTLRDLNSALGRGNRGYHEAKARDAILEYRKQNPNADPGRPDEAGDRPGRPDRPPHGADSPLPAPKGAP